MTKPQKLTGARGRVAAEKTRKAAAAKAARMPAKAAPARKAAGKGRTVPAPAKAPADGAPAYRGWWADAAEGAAKGKMPPAPDFSAATHTRFRAKLAALVDLAKAGDVAALKAVDINPISTSPKAMARYRDLAVMALLAR